LRRASALPPPPLRAPAAGKVRRRIEMRRISRCFVVY